MFGLYLPCDTLSSASVLWQLLFKLHPSALNKTSLGQPQQHVSPQGSELLWALYAQQIDVVPACTKNCIYYTLTACPNDLLPVAAPEDGFREVVDGRGTYLWHIAGWDRGEKVLSKVETLQEAEKGQCARLIPVKDLDTFKTCSCTDITCVGKGLSEEGVSRLHRKGVTVGYADKAANLQDILSLESGRGAWA